MRKRCLSKSSKSYENYGGRGIKICKEWSTFEGFLKDMLPTYSLGLTLERKEVNGDYCKDNCCWVDRKAQANNKRNNHYVTYNGETLTLSEFAAKYGADYELFRHRINDGWDIEKALSGLKEKETIVYNGVTKTVAEFAEEYGMTYHQLKKRLLRGWTVTRALAQPLRTKSTHIYV
jgi:hypothetical protein